MLNEMQDEIATGVAAGAVSGSEDIEDFLMDSVADDDRLGNGSAAHEADNVLDFIQMTGLATRSRTHYPDDEEYPSNDTVSFFEEGVGDVDGGMDPMLPGMDFDASANSGPIDFGTPGESVNELTEIISELTQLESTTLDFTPTTHPVDAPQREEESSLPPSVARPHETETSRAFAELTALQSHLSQEPDSIATDSYTPELEEPDLAITETLESESAATISDLQEAKSLLDELEVSGTPHEDPIAPAGVQSLPAVAPIAAFNEDASLTGKARSQSYMRQRHRRRRRVGRWGVRLILVALSIGVAFAAVQFYLNQAETPHDAYRSAEKLLEDGKYEQASKEFQAFVRRFPTELKTSDAMFMAGYSMQLAPPTPRDRAQASYEESLKLLERFIVENPSHTKAARAETLMGVLYFRMDMPIEAIRILGGPDRRLRDPGAYLTTLRTLARAYASVSQVENARSAFMRAASLEENITPDEDYVELGSMYHKLAERSATAEVELEYRIKAIEQWDYALRVPGLLKSRREEIRLIRDIVASKVDEANIVGASVQTGNGAAE